MNNEIATSKRPLVLCDLNQKKWLNEKEAIAYLGMGNANMFKEWRANGLQYFQPGRKILYRRTDLDKWIEKTMVKGF